MPARSRQKVLFVAKKGLQGKCKVLGGFVVEKGRFLGIFQDKGKIFHGTVPAPNHAKAVSSPPLGRRPRSAPFSGATLDTGRARLPHRPGPRGCRPATRRAPSRLSCSQVAALSSHFPSRFPSLGAMARLAGSGRRGKSKSPFQGKGRFPSHFRVLSESFSIFREQGQDSRRRVP